MSRQPLPAAVYWRRRLLVVALVIAIVWLAFRLVPSDADEPAAAPVNAPKVVAAAVPTNGTLDVALSTSSKRCDPQQVRVTPSVPSDQQVRGPVRIDLLLSSTARASCTLQPKDAEMIAIISSGGDPVWDSTMCSASLLADPVVISARWATRVQATWSGRSSGRSCSNKEAWTIPGRYDMKVGTLGGEPGEVRFDLSARVQPTPTATPTPTASPKDD